MDNKDINTKRDRGTISRNTSSTGAEQRYNTDTENKGSNTADEHRAELNGREGKFETERTRPTGETSALPGAEEKEPGTAAAGAGLGGNKGTGTSSKKNLD